MKQISKNFLSACLKTIVAITLMVIPQNFFAEETQEKTAEIIFMHDVHSFLNGTSRAKTVIDREKEKNPDAFIFDAGDIAMGTLYQTVFSTKAVELRVLGKLGVDATTIGNHEFDYGAEGLASMMYAASESKDKIPAYVLCNVDLSANDSYTNTLRPALEKLNRKDYVVIQKGDLRIAAIGVLGKDALMCAPTCKLTVKDQIESVKQTVSKIQQIEKVDMIVCLSHSGTNKDKSKSEDEILAKAVPELSLIISGHTHTVLEKPIIIGNTAVVSCGAYSENLGALKMQKNKSGKWEVKDYKLIPLDESIPEDKNISALLDSFLLDVDKEYLSKFNFSGKQVLTKANADISRSNEVGYIMANAIADSVKNLEGKELDVAIVPDGVLRGTYQKGNVTVSDVFNSYSLGIGPDKITGYPLVGIYITGSDLKTAMEIDVSLSPLMDTVKLYTSGISYEYNPKRFMLDKVTNVYLEKADGTKEPVQKDKLYRIITDIYTAKMLKGILSKTKGLITVVPRNKDGKLIENFDDAIIYVDGKNVDGQNNKRELKGWFAIAKYLEKSPTILLPAKTEKELKVCKSSISPFAIFSNPSKVAIIIYSAVLIIIAIIIFIVVLCIKKSQKNKLKKQ